MAGLPTGKSERFTAEETDLLVREVKARQNQIYGDSRQAPKLPEVKQAWEEVAAIVSSSSGITRTVTQCRKRYNDVRRRGKQRVAAHRHQQHATGGGPPNTTDDLTPAEDIAASTLSVESIEGFGGLQVGVQAPLADDPGAGPSCQEQAAVVGEEETAPAPPTRRRRRQLARSEDHPFVEVQRGGFTMLERELGGLRRSVGRLNTRLSRVEGLLRPLGRIADSLDRLAGAAERLLQRGTPPDSPPPPPPPPISVSSTLDDASEKGRAQSKLSSRAQLSGLPRSSPRC
ncbi:myb-related transcription factor, partner of profilin-like [Epinephelus moara]|uniref:myb-related transcription factor, partner of profilin-like n=1 Tax=Epinephelus moara TaxID=300413 RepID=UPI00214E191F|nr:myb-related transcription factor, partner of profilin-like [Epinephelus moara]